MIASIKLVTSKFQKDTKQRYPNPNQQQGINNHKEYQSLNQSNKEPQISSYSESCCFKIAKIIPISMIILALSDQFSDIAYVVETWDKFPSTSLRNLAVFFSFYETFTLAACFLLGDLMIYYSQLEEEESYKCLKSIGKLVLLLIMSPLYLLFSIFKINQIIYKVILPNFTLKKSEQYKDTVVQANLTANLRDYSENMVIYVIAEVLLQSIPEFVIQFITNQSIGEWSTIGKISAILSFLITISAIGQVLYEWYSSSSNDISINKRYQKETESLCDSTSICLGLILIAYLITCGIIGGIIIHTQPLNTDFWVLVALTFAISWISIIVVIPVLGFLGLLIFFGMNSIQEKKSANDTI